MVKKILAGLLAAVMGVGMLTGCGSDPVADDFEQYMNTDMVDVNANYEKIKDESAKWENYETDDEYIDSIKNVIMPTIEDSFDKLSKIEPQTTEVKEIKDKYVKVMDAYKSGYEILLNGFENGDESSVEEASAKIDEGVELLNDYNSALEALAKEKGMTVEY